MTNTATMFEYLDALRVSGITNMFGARPYLEEAFSLDRREAATILTGWMNTFGDGSAPAEKRAEQFDAERTQDAINNGISPGGGGISEHDAD